MPVALSDFLGAWHLERDILHADGGRGQFTGTAVWQADGAGALYTESGTLAMPAQGRFHAERRYIWEADLTVRFEDGRFFHQVPLDGGVASHWCDPDQYDAEYSFDAWPSWSCTWRVRGPRKDYTMQSRFRRIAA